MPSVEVDLYHIVDKTLLPLSPWLTNTKLKLPFTVFFCIVYPYLVLKYLTMLHSRRTASSWQCREESSSQGTSPHCPFLFCKNSSLLENTTFLLYRVWLTEAGQQPPWVSSQYLRNNPGLQVTLSNWQQCSDDEAKWYGLCPCSLRLRWNTKELGSHYYLWRKICNIHWHFS